MSQGSSSSSKPGKASPTKVDPEVEAKPERRQFTAEYKRRILGLYRLRADLLDLLPEGERKQEDLIELQEDRLRYAMLSPGLRDLPDEEKRLAALALARPAIFFEGVSLRDVPENWATLLRRHDTAIRSAACSAPGECSRIPGRYR